MIWDTLAFYPGDMRYFCFGCHLFAEVLQERKKTGYFERLCWECTLENEEGLGIFAGLPCYGRWRWTVIESSLIPVEVLFFHSCWQPLSDWSLWLYALSSLSEIFDKLPVISAKLSVHVTGADEAEKDWRLFDIWDRRFDKLSVIFAKLSVHVIDADEAEKDWRLFDIWDRPVVSEQPSFWESRRLFDLWACLFDFWTRLFDFWKWWF